MICVPNNRYWRMRTFSTTHRQLRYTFAFSCCLHIASAETTGAESRARRSHSRHCDQSGQRNGRWSVLLQLHLMCSKIDIQALYQFYAVLAIDDQKPVDLSRSSTFRRQKKSHYESKLQNKAKTVALSRQSKSAVRYFAVHDWLPRHYIPFLGSLC